MSAKRATKAKQKVTRGTKVTQLGSSARKAGAAKKKKKRVTKARPPAKKAKKKAPVKAKTKAKAKKKVLAKAKPKAPDRAKKKVPVKTRPARTKKAPAVAKPKGRVKPEKKVAAETQSAPIRKIVTAKKERSPKAPARARGAAAAARRRKLAHLKPILEEKRRNLFEAYTAAKGESRATGTDGTEDYIDYAVSSYTREFSLSLTEWERTQLRLVDDALQRFGSPEFGRCQNCATEIPLPRLEVEPWARHCIPCQELDEQGLLKDHAFNVDEADEDETIDDDAVTTESAAGIVEEDDEEGDAASL